jgi:4-amino-4-deoxy-L-arabinose transferase-like glycosyltransferase
MNHYAETTDRRLREFWILLMVCVAALTIRLVFLADWATTPLFHVLLGDEQNFHQTALSLLGQAGDQTPGEVFLYQPLYSFYLALVYAIFGEDAGLPRTLQLLVGMGTCLLFYGLGRELHNRWTGRLAAVMVALYGPLVFLEGQLLAPGITVPLIAGALWSLLAAVKRARTWLFPIAGLLIGLAIMGRPNLAVLLPVAGVWLLTRPGSFKLKAASLGLAFAGLVVGLSPAWIHNAMRGGDFVLVSASGGHSFYIGNNPQATGAFHVASIRGIDDSNHRAYRRSLTFLAERAEGKKLSPAEVSSFWFRRGLEYWREDPAGALRLTGKKLLLALNTEELAIHHPYVFGKELAPVLRFLVPFGVVFPFFVLGVWFGGRRREGAGMLTWCAALYLATLVFYYVADRYRVVVLPMILPMAALGMLGLKDRFQKRGWRGAWPAMAVLAVTFAVTQLPMLSGAYRARAVARGYNRMGKVEGDRGKLAQAEIYFRHAIRLAGNDPNLQARTNLGLVLEYRGDTQGAQRLYLQTVELDPNNRNARIRLARLAERSGDLTGAIRWWEELFKLQANPESARREISRLRALQERNPDPRL